MELGGKEVVQAFLTCIIPCHKDQYPQIQDGLQPVRPPKLNFSACKYPVPPLKGGYIIQESDTSSSSTYLCVLFIHIFIYR